MTNDADLWDSRVAEAANAAAIGLERVLDDLYRALGMLSYVLEQPWAGDAHDARAVELKKAMLACHELLDSLVD